LTNEASTQLARTLAVPPKSVATHDWWGRMRCMFFDFTQGAVAGADGSTARLFKLPAGKVRLILPLSRMHHSAFGASRVLNLGWEAYKNLAGADVLADPDGLDAAVDVSAAGNFTPAGTLGTHETLLFESQEGVVIAAEITGGTLLAGAELSGHLVAVQD